MRVLHTLVLCVAPLVAEPSVGKNHSEVLPNTPIDPVQIASIQNKRLPITEKRHYLLMNADASTGSLYEKFFNYNLGLGEAGQGLWSVEKDEQYYILHNAWLGVSGQKLHQLNQMVQVKKGKLEKTTKRDLATRFEIFYDEHFVNQVYFCEPVHKQCLGVQNGKVKMSSHGTAWSLLTMGPNIFYSARVENIPDRAVVMSAHPGLKMPFQMIVLVRPSPTSQFAVRDGKYLLVQSAVENGDGYHFLSYRGNGNLVLDRNRPAATWHLARNGNDTSFTVRNVFEGFAFPRRYGHAIADNKAWYRQKHQAFLHKTQADRLEFWPVFGQDGVYVIRIQDTDSFITAGLLGSTNVQFGSIPTPFRLVPLDPLPMQF